MSAIDDISTERNRQVSKGYDAAHDDAHSTGEILKAVVAICEDVSEINGGFYADWIDELREHISDKYRASIRQRLVIASAMLVAEIERMDRK